MPPKSIRPSGSEEAGEIALESAFVAAEESSEVGSPSCKLPELSHLGSEVTPQSPHMSQT